MPPGAYPGRGERPRPDESYPARRDDGYPAPRDDGYPARRDDGYPARRDDGYPARRDDGHAPRRDDGYAPRRGDGYPARRENGNISYRNADYSPAREPSYPSIPDGRFAPRPAAPRPAAPRPDYDGYRDRGAAYDRSDYDRTAHDRTAYDRTAYDRPASDRPAYDRPAYDRPAYDRPADDRAAPSSQRPGTGELPPPGSWPENENAASERSAKNRADIVPQHNQVAVRAEYQPADRNDDDTMTSPLPVILPGATTVPRPAPVEAPRGPFEPARPSQGPVRPHSITGSVEPPPTDYPPPVPPPPRALPEAATAKLDQIKDLYFTAEAIGPEALDKHFDQVSDRQRELIREFFQRSEPGDAGTGRPQA